MHMRPKSWARTETVSNPAVEGQPEERKNNWRSLYVPGRPFYVELGCGKGISAARMALDNPEINYLLVDVSPDMIGISCRNLMEAGGGRVPENVRLTRYDITYIGKILGAEDQADRIYINFCNPWTEREKHHKRRLTHPRQLEQYRTFLRPQGEIWFKTDDDALFRDSLYYFSLCGFREVYRTEDLHGSGFAPNYISEHEEKYTALGVSIKFGIFRMEEREGTFDATRWRMGRNGEK